MNSLLLLCEKYNPSCCVFEGISHLFVSKCINKWIKQRGNGRSEHRHRFINSCSFLCRGLDVDEDAAAITDGNHNRVGGAGGKGLLPLLGRRESEDGLGDVCVGEDYTHQGHSEHQRSKTQGNSLC